MRTKHQIRSDSADRARAESTEETVRACLAHVGEEGEKHPTPARRCDTEPMGPPVHSRADCDACGAELVFLVCDPSVGYEDIDPTEGGPRTLVEHTTQRCEFHRFLTPEPGRHVLPGNADWLTKRPVGPSQPRLRYLRWVRDDQL